MRSSTPSPYKCPPRGGEGKEALRAPPRCAARSPRSRGHALKPTPCAHSPVTKQPVEQSGIDCFQLRPALPHTTARTPQAGARGAFEGLGTPRHPPTLKSACRGSNRAAGAAAGRARSSSGPLERYRGRRCYTILHYCTDKIGVLRLQYSHWQHAKDAKWHAKT